jgi:hypothetical protein
MTDAPQTKPARLAVPGATLYYKMQGHGPLLLMLQGGDGDADGTDALTSHVIDHWLRQVLSEYVSSVDNGGDSLADRAKGIEP